MALLKAGTKIDDRTPTSKDNHKHEIHIPMNLAEITTTSDTYVDVPASEVYINLSNFLGYDIYFEANLARLGGTSGEVRLWDIDNTRQVAEFSQTTNGYVFTRFRSAALTTLGASRLKVQIKGTGTTPAAYVKAARMVLIPK